MTGRYAAPPVGATVVGFAATPIAARFVARPNRFVVEARLEADGSCVAAHLADPGRLRDVLVPGRRLWLVPTDNPARKTRWSVALTEAPDRVGLVSVDATLPNRLVGRALREGTIPELGGWRLDRSEARMAHGRVDFLLRDEHGFRMALEVKSATLVENGIARFPDAVTARGRRHVRGLAELCATEGWRSTLMFVVQRSDAGAVSAAPEIDPAFAEALADAREAGVRLLARRCQVSLDGVALAAAIPVLP